MISVKFILKIKCYKGDLMNISFVIKQNFLMKTIFC